MIPSLPDLIPSLPDLSRRAFLGHLTTLSLIGVGAPTLLSACGDGDDTTIAVAPPVLEASTCRGYDPKSAPIRQSLGYVDASPNAGQYCSNCRFYSAPGSTSDRCGTCQVIPGVSGNGPVSPGGYCRSWAAAPA